MNISYEKDSEKTLKDFNESNEIWFLKFKHKTESTYNQIIAHRNFYPIELDFSNNDDVERKVKLNKNNSNYTSNYWQDASFPNMQTIFSSFFKGDLKEKENKK
jgi:hypothetical protein